MTYADQYIEIAITVPTIKLYGLYVIHPGILYVQLIEVRGDCWFY